MKQKYVSIAKQMSLTKYCLLGRHHQQCRWWKKSLSRLIKTPFKDRFRNHVRDFNNKIHYNKTELSKYAWDLKRNNKETHITWTNVCIVYGTPKRNFCRLCLKEKPVIIKFPNQDNLLNKRSEFINKCRHENKNLIMNVK